MGELGSRLPLKILVTFLLHGVISMDNYHFSTVLSIFWNYMRWDLYWSQLHSKNTPDRRTTKTMDRDAEFSLALLQSPVVQVVARPAKKITTADDPCGVICVQLTNSGDGRLLNGA